MTDEEKKALASEGRNGAFVKGVRVIATNPLRVQERVKRRVGLSGETKRGLVDQEVLISTHTR